MNCKFLFSNKWIKKNSNKEFYYSSSQFLNINSNVFSDAIEKIEENQIDFGFVFEDKTNETVVLVTDRYSTIPIYYSVFNETLLISDYIKTLVDIAKPEFDQDSIVEQLCFDYVYTKGKTIYSGIYKVPSGTRLRISKDFNISYEESLSSELPQNRKGQNLPDGIESQIEESINSIVDKYEKLYIPLSGGLDSRFVCGIISKTNKHRIVSRTYGDRNSLDVRYACKLASLMNITHEWVNKTDQEAISEFEMLVEESKGTLNGVHAHDLKGREIFENDKDCKARVSGFIGDVYARGTNMIELERNEAYLIQKIMHKSSNFYNYNYQKLLQNENAREVLERAVKSQCSSYFDIHHDYKGIYWDYYQSVRIPNMVSLIEYFSHINKPNVKPFMIPLVRKVLSEYAGRDIWNGMNY
ncbi:MAG: asparagine synthase-related protein, partial [Parachlamydiaceae bacterium]|nr:asparagine synthase-related protein [Parachlamydiaceae bacterium]